MPISQGTPTIADSELALLYAPGKAAPQRFRKDGVMSAWRETKPNTGGTGVEDLHVWLSVQPKDRPVDLLLQPAGGYMGHCGSDFR